MIQPALSTRGGPINVRGRPAMMRASDARQFYVPLIETINRANPGRNECDSRPGPSECSGARDAFQNDSRSLPASREME